MNPMPACHRWWNVLLFVLPILLASCAGPTSSSGVRSVTIDQADLELAVDSSFDLTATVIVYGGASRDVSWRSDRTDVATVAPTGSVTAVAPGTARITATSLADPTQADRVTVTVEPAPDEPAPNEPSATPMILTVDTTLGGGDGRTVTLALRGSVDVAVDWGDGQRSVAIASGDPEHTYVSGGAYTIEITGSATQFGAGTLGGDHARVITAVTSWGDLGLESLAGAFASAHDLVSVPDTLPSTVTNTSFAFASTRSFQGDLAGWDVGNVTDMRGMFVGSAFHGEIGGWDVGSVTSMREMFHGSDFAGDIGDWDVANVTDMGSMFYDATRFDRDIGGWDVSSVTDMSGMFGASEYDHPFDRDIGNWDVSNVTDMSGMFGGFELAEGRFDQDIGRWDVSNVVDMSYMFGYSSFDQDIGGWDVSNVTTMAGMFFAKDFDRDIGGWDVSSVVDTSYMFAGQTDRPSSFDRDIGAWDVSNVVTMRGMFRDNVTFDRDIGSWDVAEVRDMDEMFQGTERFDRDLSDWCVFRIPTEPFDFAAGAFSWTLPQPVWGTCP